MNAFTSFTVGLSDLSKIEDETTKLLKMQRKVDSEKLRPLEEAGTVRIEIPERQLLLLQQMHTKFEEIASLIDRRLKELNILINPTDITPRFRAEETLLENAYKFVRDVERKSVGLKPQNYETQNCKNFNQLFDGIEKVIVQTNPEQTNKGEISFMYDLNKIYKIGEFVNSGISAQEAIQNLENFASVIELVINGAKENLVFEYENEMNKLEDILNQNDKFLEELEESMAEMSMD